MAYRPDRDPRRIDAFELFKEHKGRITNTKIAEALGVAEGTIRTWKKQDKWVDALTGGKLKTEKTDGFPDEPVEYKVPITPEEVLDEHEYWDIELTEKQRDFVIYYVKYWSQIKAHMKAYGSSYKTANKVAYAVFKLPKVQKAIRIVRDNVMEDVMMSKKALLQKWIDIAFADMTDFVEFGSEEVIATDHNGEPVVNTKGEQVIHNRNYVALKDHKRIDGTIVTELKQGKDGVTIKLGDKMKALEYLSKHYDLLDEKNKSKLIEEKLRYEVAIAKETAAKISGDKKDTSMLESLLGAFKKD